MWGGMSIQLAFKTTSLDVITKEVYVAQRKGLKSDALQPFGVWGDEEKLTKGTEKSKPVR